MSDPTTCDICGSLQCAKTICPILRERFHAQAARLAAVEARLFGVDEHQPWCRVRNGERACNCYSGRPAPPPSAEPTTAPVASGASVPDGYVLGEGWRLAERDWACTPFRGRCLSAGAAYETTTTEDGPMCGVGACPAHAVEMGALVPVEPPKAETAQAGVFTTPDVVAAVAQANAELREQPAEPSAPVGSLLRPAVVVAPRPGRPAATSCQNFTMGLPGCTWKETHCMGHCKDGDACPFKRAIAEPAAPPVAAKLSEAGCNFCRVIDRCDCCALPLGEGESDTCGDCRGVMPPARRKVDAAKKSYRTLEMDLDAAKRDRGQLREQLNVAKREHGELEGALQLSREALQCSVDEFNATKAALDAAKAENEALRKERQEIWDAAQSFLAASDARIAGLEGLLRRAITYAREDRMRTPGVTRLARVLGEAERAIASGDPAPRVGG